MDDGQALLNRGLLLGLAELRRHFLTDSDRFHAAYRAALATHKDKTTERALENYDPVFGVYHEAEGMILDGMRDLILALDRRTWRCATFLISAQCARQELDELPGHEHYRTMAAKFHESL